MLAYYNLKLKYFEFLKHKKTLNICCVRLFVDIARSIQGRILARVTKNSGSFRPYRWLRSPMIPIGKRCLYVASAFVFDTSNVPYFIIKSAGVQIQIVIISKILGVRFFGLQRSLITTQTLLVLHNA